MLEENSFVLFRDIGRDLFLRGLVSSHAGNISLRIGQKICITRRGSRKTRGLEGCPYGLSSIDRGNVQGVYCP